MISQLLPALCIHPFSVSSPVSQLHLAFCIPAPSNLQYLSFIQVLVSTFHPCFLPAVGSLSLIQFTVSLSLYLFLILSPLRLILFILPFIRTLYPASVSPTLFSYLFSASLYCSLFSTSDLSKPPPPPVFCFILPASDPCRVRRIPILSVSILRLSTQYQNCILS
jgi:hypothetical protein